MKPLLAILVPVIALCAVFAVFHLGAQTTPIAINQQLSTFGMVGLSTGETARLNAFALPLSGGPIIAGGCEVTFTFYDEKGSSLASTTLPVTQGQAVHFDMPGTAPQEIRGTVRTMFNSPTAGVRAFNGCSVLPTEEIFNSSGQVIAILELSRALPTVLPL